MQKGKEENSFSFICGGQDQVGQSSGQPGVVGGIPHGTGTR